MRVTSSHSSLTTSFSCSLNTGISTEAAPHHAHEGDQLTLLAHHQLLLLLKHRNINRD
jgi:hypothetical protein